MLINKYTNDSLPVLSFIISTSVSLLFQCSTVSIIDFSLPQSPRLCPHFAPRPPYIENPAAAHGRQVFQVGQAPSGPTVIWLLLTTRSPHGATGLSLSRLKYSRYQTVTGSS